MLGLDPEKKGAKLKIGTVALIECPEQHIKVPKTSHRRILEFQAWKPGIPGNKSAPKPKILNGSPEN